MKPTLWQIISIGVLIFFTKNASCQDSISINFDIIDTTISPGDNFYEFSSGLWLKSNSLPIGEHRFGFYDVADQTIENQLIFLIKSCAENIEAETNICKKTIGNFYLSGIHHYENENIGISAISEEMQMIENISELKDLTPVLAYFQLIGINPFFEIYDYKSWEVRGTHYLYLRQAELSLSGNLQYFDDKICEILKKFIYENFILLGEDSIKALQNAEIVLKIEKQLSEKMQTEAQLQNSFSNYHLYSIKKMEKIFSSIVWKKYFEILEINKKKAIIAQPEYFAEIEKMLLETSPDDWKIYLKWRLIYKSAKYLNSDFAEKYYEFQSRISSFKISKSETEIFVCQIIKNSLPDITGHLYCEKYFDEQSQKEVLKIIETLKQAFINRIINNSWLSEKAKKSAIIKIGKMSFKIGEPEFSENDFSDLMLSKTDFIQNIFFANEYVTKKRLKKCGQEIQNSEWDINAYSTNAWYNVNRNDITLPAGNIAQLFDIEKDNAYNYGTFATTIAHEMAHTFDNTGHLYDESGKFKNLWTKDDEENFKKLSEKLIKHYNAFHLIDTFYVNGKNSLNENIADLGGLNIAFDAYCIANKQVEDIEINGYTGEQRFFIAFAQKWRDILSDELKKYYSLYYYHAPPEFRANGTLYNLDIFYEVFEITKGELYLPKYERIIIW